MADVFISYSRSSQEVVRQLAEAVKRLGYSVWWDDELPPHRSYSDVITDQIGEAKAAIVVWSQNAAESEWVRAEADVARGQKKLIQTSLDGRMPPMPFNQIQFAAIGDWHGEDDHPGWMKVKASLAALCGPPGAAPVPAPAPQYSAPTTVAVAPAGRRSPLVPALGGLLLLAVLGLIYLLWSRSPATAPTAANPPAAAPAAAAAPAPSAPVQQAANVLPPPAATDGTFTEAATLEGADASAIVRGGPSADAFAVGHVARGEVFTTYPQQGDWWRVRTADGTIGYLAHPQIRVIPVNAPVAEAAAPRPAPQASATPPRQSPARQPAPPPVQTAAAAQPPGQAKPNGPTPQQIQNMRRFCNGGPGQGTPQCIQFHQRMAARQRAMQGGY